MFDTMRGSLKGEIEEDSISMKVKGKMHSFLDQNPDVDHYLSDTIYSKIRSRFWVGIVFGILISFVIFLLVSLVAMTWWHDLGYLRFPDMTGWS